MIKCKNCKRSLYSYETKESHLEVCGGIDNDSAEAIGDIEDHFVIICPMCGIEVDSEDDLTLSSGGKLLCFDCAFERGVW